MDRTRTFRIATDAIDTLEAASQLSDEEVEALRLVLQMAETWAVRHPLKEEA
jgi:hypothetical protein